MQLELNALAVFFYIMLRDMISKDYNFNDDERIYSTGQI